MSDDLEKARLIRRLEEAWASDDREHEMRVAYEEALLSLVDYVQETAHHNAPAAAAARAVLRKYRGDYQ